MRGFAHVSPRRRLALFALAGIVALGAFVALTWTQIGRPLVGAVLEYVMTQRLTPENPHRFSDCLARIDFAYATPIYAQAFKGRNWYEAISPIGEAINTLEQPVAMLNHDRQVPGSYYIAFSKNCGQSRAMAESLTETARRAAPAWLILSVSDQPIEIGPQTIEPPPDDHPYAAFWVTGE